MCVVVKVITPNDLQQSFLRNLIPFLKFVFPCIASTITIDNQQDATLFIYLL